MSCEINYSDSTQMSPEDVKRKQAALEATLNAQVGSTSNPLDEAGGNGIPSNVSTTVGSEGADSEQMNPIVRALYNKAIQNFDGHT